MIVVVKMIVFTALAAGSALAFLLVRNKPWRVSFEKRAVVLATALKFTSCAVIYALWPDLNRFSDAKVYYLPQALALLDGRLPYRDFPSAYSILFVPFVSIPVSVWANVGSIVLTMLMVETVMLAVYVRYCDRRQWRGGWSVAFLYCFSPFSCYWVAFAGHNGVIVAAGVMVALLLAEARKAAWSGAAAAATFLLSKVLAVISWPAVIFCLPRGRLRRAAPPFLSLLLVALVIPFGIDSLGPIKSEVKLSTGGGLWALLGGLLPALNDGTAMRVLPLLSYTVLFVPMAWSYLRRRQDGSTGFDAAAAFVAASNLLFLILTRKAFSYYALMTWIFVLHVLVRDGRWMIRRLIPVVFLSAVSFVEEVHYSGGPWVLVLDALRIAAYAYLLVVCFRLAVGAEPRALPAKSL